MAAQAPPARIGWPAPGFTLRGADGRLHALSEFAGSRGTVVAFICNHCPYVRAILPRLIRDACALDPLGVRVIAINPNDADSHPEDSFERMTRIAPMLSFPYLHDVDQDVARAYGAVCTPDFFGFDADLRLKYRGRLDASRKESAPSEARRELFEAMREIAATGQAPPSQEACIGCSIKWIGSGG